MLTRSSSSHVIFFSETRYYKKRKEKFQLNKGENKFGSTSALFFFFSLSFSSETTTLHTTNKQTNKQKIRSRETQLIINSEKKEKEEQFQRIQLPTILKGVFSPPDQLKEPNGKPLI
jgi:hypothetical protein